MGNEQSGLEGKQNKLVDRELTWDSPLESMRGMQSRIHRLRQYLALALNVLRKGLVF